MKDFDSYKKEENVSEQDVFSMFSDLAAKYEGKSGDEVMKAIIEEAERGKKNGTLKNEDIDKFAETISPMLNDKQRKMLEKIVKRIKD